MESFIVFRLLYVRAMTSNQPKVTPVSCVGVLEAGVIFE